MDGLMRDSERRWAAEQAKYRREWRTGSGGGRFWTYEAPARLTAAAPAAPKKQTEPWETRLHELYAELQALRREHDAFVQDMDRKGRGWTRDIGRNAKTIEQTAAEDKERAARIEQDSLDRDAELDGRAQDIDGRSVERDVYVMETSLERDTALSAAINQIEPGQQIDYTEYFKQIVSGQFDYRPYLMRLLRTQGYMEEKP